MKTIHLILLAISITACSNSDKKGIDTKSLNQEFSIYSSAVKDSFYVSVQLPENYYRDSTANYPTVYVLDANFHFPMLASVIKQYEKAEMLPPIILVGIGYKSLRQMDSLRVRDYMYPASLPSDEMNAVGGGKSFHDFIANQLVAYIDTNYNTQKNNRSLLGHSFGGYFSLYALLNQIDSSKSVFKNFASASPSLWYNDFYLNQLTDKLTNRNNRDTLNIFMAVGGLEDSTWNIAPVRELGNSILSADIKDIEFQYKVYSDLAHMDIATVTFTKALQAFYKQDK
ncbi:alpha/beta hydrolase [Telluribacter humicola]|uniref:alpha/beta hydrolase n=1 Tax=Telluribacter humicola TaxID=1720261 RepID=UPI001A9739CB|nr:alpha/beta hydrolase-fold protein [Telluribacter humicola]